MGAKAYVAAIIANFKIRVMVLRVNNPGEGIYEGHGLVIVAELERAAYFPAGAVDSPAFMQVMQQLVSLFAAQRMALPWLALFAAQVTDAHGVT